jgi:hypothetical protein
MVERTKKSFNLKENLWSEKTITSTSCIPNAPKSHGIPSLAMASQGSF